MTVILGIVAPVFLIIALGYGAAKRSFVDQAGFKGLNTFAFFLAQPALLFLGGTTGAVGGGRAALAFFLGTAMIYAGTLLAARFAAGRSLGAAGMLALDATFGNTVMMGIPLITAAFGAEALAVLLAILALHSLVLLGVATVVAEIGLHAHAPWRRVLRATVAGVGRNPIVMAVAVALAWRLLGLPLPPAFVRRALGVAGRGGAAGGAVLPRRQPRRAGPARGLAGNAGGRLAQAVRHAGGGVGRLRGAGRAALRNRGDGGDRGTADGRQRLPAGAALPDRGGPLGRDGAGDHGDLGRHAVGAAGVVALSGGAA